MFYIIIIRGIVICGKMHLEPANTATCLNVYCIFYNKILDMILKMNYNVNVLTIKIIFNMIIW